MIGCRVDRSGAREGKKSLRSNKQKVHEVKTKVVTEDSGDKPKYSQQPPELLPIQPQKGNKSMLCYT